MWCVCLTENLLHRVVYVVCLFDRKPTVSSCLCGVCLTTNLPCRVVYVVCLFDGKPTASSCLCGVFV